MTQEDEESARNKKLKLGLTSAAVAALLVGGVGLTYYSTTESPHRPVVAKVEVVDTWTQVKPYTHWLEVVFPDGSTATIPSPYYDVTKNENLVGKTLQVKITQHGTEILEVE